MAYSLTLSAVVFASLITVADTGAVFQPALSLDGTRLAWAEQFSDGSVALWAKSLAANQDPVELARWTDRKSARRLAMQSLLHSPWSATGDHALYLTSSGASTQLYIVGADGKGTEAVGPEQTVVEAASWLGARAAVVYAYRESRSAPDLTIARSEIGSGDTKVLYRASGNTAALDVIASPDGQRVAVLLLEGPRFQRTRVLRVIEVDSGKQMEVVRGRLPDEPRANFVHWSSNSSRLYFVDTNSDTLLYWASDMKETYPAATDVFGVTPTMHDDIIIVQGPQARLEVIALESGTRTVLGERLVATSASISKLALLRLGAKGAAIVVTDLDPQRLVSGELDLGTPAPGDKP